MSLVLGHRSRVLGAAETLVWHAVVLGVPELMEHAGLAICDVQGIGEIFINHLIERFYQRGCGLMQLASYKRRDKAYPFYE